VRSVDAEMRHSLCREGGNDVDEYRQDVFPHNPPRSLALCKQFMSSLANRKSMELGFPP